MWRQTWSELTLNIRDDSEPEGGRIIICFILSHNSGFYVPSSSVSVTLVCFLAPPSSVNGFLCQSKTQTTQRELHWAHYLGREWAAHIELSVSLFVQNLFVLTYNVTFNEGYCFWTYQTHCLSAQREGGPELNLFIPTVTFVFLHESAKWVLFFGVS